jgi:hypothetical protein
LKNGVALLAYAPVVHGDLLQWMGLDKLAGRMDCRVKPGNDERV